nr:TetR/AcrR family transcriptional regulator [uncultured Lichenicoccus sp.]
MKGAAKAGKPSRFYVVSLDNRKARGSGHERVGEILEAARELFLQHGVENVSTRQIATRVGISQTALYVYFKNKGEMLDRLTEGAFRDLGEAMKEVSDRHNDPVDFLRAWIPEYVRFGLKHPDEYRLTFLLRDGRHPGLLPQEQRQIEGRKVFSDFRERLAAAQASGALRSSTASPEALAQSIWAAMHGLVALLLAFSDFDWVKLDELVRVHADMLLGGLVAKPDPPRTAVMNSVSAAVGAARPGAKARRRGQTAPTR